jgi:hypothetical protein
MACSKVGDKLGGEDISEYYPEGYMQKKLASRAILAAAAVFLLLGYSSPGLTAAQQQDQQKPSPAAQPSQPAQSPTPVIGTPSKPENVVDDSWEILDDTSADKSTENRTKAMQALAILVKDDRAEQLAVKGLADKEPEVRAAAASSLGDMQAAQAIPNLYDAMSDKNAAVAIAAARALLALKDNRGYDVFYAVLTGTRKGGKGVVEKELDQFRDPHKLAWFGFNTGVGFLPWGGVGLDVLQIFLHNSQAPSMAAAALSLAKDPDPLSGQALIDALTNKYGLVRASAAKALAERSETRALPKIQEILWDKDTYASCSAAAAYIHLSNLSHAPEKAKPAVPRKKKTAAPANPATQPH